MDGDGVHGAAHGRLAVLLILREMAEDSLSCWHKAEDPRILWAVALQLTHIDHRLCVCVHICLCVCVHIYMHVHMCGVYVICTYSCMFICMYIVMHTHICMCGARI